MRTIQMTIDEHLLHDVDKVVSEIGTSRSEFIRDALQLVLRRRRLADLERRHAAGYAKHPVQPGEFDVWFEEQAWPDE